jgi:16S rRNA (cytosine1402-N4)-methyltransferase
LPEGFLTSFDKDPEAFDHGLLRSDKNFKIINESFCKLNSYFLDETVDGIIFDLGTCSTHFDDKERGFSFRQEGPLDMRFNTLKGIPLSTWINSAKELEIRDILYKFGDEKHAKIIARAIVNLRKDKPIETTIQLADIIEDIYPERKNKTHPATKSFQAFRIFINNELDELKESLEMASKVVKKNGIIVVISFHSLEDNIVKNFFKPNIKSYPKDIPLNSIEDKKFKCIARKIRPSEEEVHKNKRSRSAIMRVYKKL